MQEEGPVKGAESVVKETDPIKGVVNKNGGGGGAGESLRLRHGGVLGLSACVLAHPYTVPPYLPQLLMDLSTHLNDPQPIQVWSHCGHCRANSSPAFFLLRF